MKRLSLILLLIVFVTAMPTAWAEQTILTTTVPSQHTLTVSFGEGGTVKVNGTTLTEGTSIAIGRHEQVVIEIVPDSGNSTDTVSISSDYGVSQQGDRIEIARMVQDVAVQVNFLSVTERYAVTVENGSGSGEYAAGELVSITANAPAEGEQFSGWTGSDGVAFADDSAAATTFIMPAKAVTATANYTAIGEPGEDVVITFPTVEQHIEVWAGDTATMTVIAEHAVRYQWYVDYGDGTGWHACGENSPTYTTSPTALNNDGYRYKCVATGANGSSAESAIFILHVLSEAALPQTGDTDNLALWLVMLSFANVIMLMFKKRVHN